MERVRARARTRAPAPHLDEVQVAVRDLVKVGLDVGEGGLVRGEQRGHVLVLPLLHGRHRARALAAHVLPAPRHLVLVQRRQLPRLRLELEAQRGGGLVRVRLQHAHQVLVPRLQLLEHRGQVAPVRLELPLRLRVLPHGHARGAQRGRALVHRARRVCGHQLPQLLLVHAHARRVQRGLLGQLLLRRRHLALLVADVLREGGPGRVEPILLRGQAARLLAQGGRVRAQLRGHLQRKQQALRGDLGGLQGGGGRGRGRGSGLRLAHAPRRRAKQKTPTWSNNRFDF